MKTIFQCLTPLLAFLFLSVSATAAFDHSHGRLDKILKQHVVGKQVDYAGLKARPGPLNTYLNVLGEVSESEFKRWNRNQELAFLINLYNAATLKLVVDHYPVKSIKKIGGFKGPWKQSVVRAFGKTYTLDQVEHELIRGNYDEARIHFAVNCASVGCPHLRGEAFRGDRLDQQLDDQTRIFLADPSKNRIFAKKGQLELSPIFKWYEEDFVKQSGSVEKFIAPYVAEEHRAKLATGGHKIRHTKYDWSLNKK
ncbi:MAG: DUF547 domain-containing protein [Verrucomicrobiota bacterium]